MAFMNMKVSFPSEMLVNFYLTTHSHVPNKSNLGMLTV
jgi:hypothetical protein